MSDTEFCLVTSISEFADISFTNKMADNRFQFIVNCAVSSLIFINLICLNRMKREILGREMK